MDKISDADVRKIEKTFLSELVSFPDNFNLLGGRFRAEFLGTVEGQQIFSAMAELGTYDLLSLRDKLAGVVDFNILLRLNAGSVFSKPIMFKAYALELVDIWKKRELEFVREKAVISEEDVNRAFEIEHFELFPKDNEDASDTFLKEAELEFQGNENPDVMKTGFDKLDELSGGFRKGELVLLGGYTGGGKTSLALNIALNVAKSGKRVVYFSLEMLKSEMHKRLVAMMTGFNRFSDLTSEEFAQVVETSKKIEQELPIEFIDDNDLTIEKMAAICSAKKDLGLVIIDHMHILPTEKVFRDQIAALTYKSRKAKNMAQDINCPILLLSQLNRSNVAREIKSPILSDLRGSGSLEQDANLVLFSYIPENLVRLQEPEDVNDPKHLKWEEEMHRIKGKAKIIVAKNRRGNTGTINARFEKERSLFIEE